MKSHTRGTLGISLVELMIVVVIIGILAAISVVGYRKYIGKARTSEATAMLAEFAAKEQLYFLESGQFLEAHSNTGMNYPSLTENAGEFWPHDPSIKWDSAREAFPVAPLPISWRRLGIRPRWPQLFCTYMVNAGAPGSALPGAVGPAMWPAPPNVPWFYAMAACNLVGEAGWPPQLSGSPGVLPVLLLTLAHDSPAIRTWQENQ